MTIFVCVLFAIAAGITMRADVLRRRLSFQRAAGWRLLTVLDVVCVAATVGAAFALIPLAIVSGGVPLYAPATWGIAVLATFGSGSAEISVRVVCLANG